MQKTTTSEDGRGVYDDMSPPSACTCTLVFWSNIDITERGPARDMGWTLPRESLGRKRGAVVSWRRASKNTVHDTVVQDLFLNYTITGTVQKIMFKKIIPSQKTKSAPYLFFL